VKLSLGAGVDDDATPESGTMTGFCKSSAKACGAEMLDITITNSPVTQRA
jgi:hypothetical protein